MKEYKIELYDRSGAKNHDHVEAETAQAAADQIREEWPKCFIVRISQVVQDWE